MSIERMSRLSLIGLREDRDRLLSELMRMSCVQVTPNDDPKWQQMCRRDVAGAAELRVQQQEMKVAADTLQKYAHIKRPFLAGRPMLRERDLLSAESLREAQRVSEAIHGLANRIGEIHTEETRVQNRRAALLPWKELEIPLSAQSSAHCVLCLGVCPANAKMDELTAQLPQQAPMAELFVIGSDREQIYLLLLCHVAQQAETMALLKTFGFSRVQFKDTQGTARDNLAEIDRRLAQLAKEREECEKKIIAYGEALNLLEQAQDALGVALERAEAAEGLLNSQRCFFLEGWVASFGLGKLETLLQKYNVAFFLREPDPDEEAPVLLKNTNLIRPFSMVTEMYSLPDYRGVDPNPLLAPFFAAFFGIMYADLAYGMVLFALGTLLLKKKRPQGTMEYMCRLLCIVGVSSMFFGLLFGGFFGDAIDQIARGFFGYSGQRTLTPTLWFSPLEDPMLMLIFSLVLGVVQVLTGMVIKAVMLFREGKPLDAIFDVGSWWVLFVGFAMLAMGGTYWVAVVGALMLVCTQGRSAKGIVGKIFGGIGSLYDITAYLSDILSYSRLMALCLAGGVIASVFNTLGVMVGPVLFLVVFAVGHAFNMAVNIIGTYVHAARLQYLEYFTKFYREGGTAFRPLAIRTKYVELIREEQ